MKGLIVRRNQVPVRPHVEAAWNPAVRGLEQEIIQMCLSLESRISGERRALGDWSVFVKGGPFSSSGARRHRLRGVFLGAPPPSLAEFRAATWLRDRLFQAPEPLAAVIVRDGAWPRRLKRPHSQIFISSEISGARPFNQAWDLASDGHRSRLCHELGSELGRMHALHFLHADLYPRNVLVHSPDHMNGSASQCPRELWFIDSWAGGATAWRNGSLRRLETDLGTWLADFEPSLREPYLQDLAGAYAQARSDNGRPIPSWTKWLASVVEARRAELRKLERDRYRLRGRPFPPAGMATAGMEPRGQPPQDQ